MTVEELINELNKVEDKTKQVIVLSDYNEYTLDPEYVHITGVVEEEPSFVELI